MPRKFLLLILLALMFIPASALGSSVVSVTVTQDSVTSGKAVERVSMWYESSPKTRYLFLPSGWDTSALKVWLSGTDSIKINGVTLKSGDITDQLTPGSTLKVSYGTSGSFKVTVMQSENINSVFITTASGSLKKIHASKATS